MRSTNKNQPTTQQPFVIGDVETAASNLTMSATSSNPALIPAGNVLFGGSDSNRTVQVTPAANQNGTALYEGITVLFLAQVFGVELTLQQQIMVVLMSILAGIGTAGVPGGSLPLIAILLNRVNVPAEGLASILGVDRLLDMCRTTLNVTGDITVASCVDRFESSDEARSVRKKPKGEA